MGRREEYEMNVREAHRMAECSVSNPDRAGWLRIAEQWLRMLRTLREKEILQKDRSRRSASRGGNSTSSH